MSAYTAKSASQQTDLESLSSLTAEGGALHGQKFPTDLVRKGQRWELSSKQMYWVKKFVSENGGEASSTPSTPSTFTPHPLVTELGVLIDDGYVSGKFATDLSQKGTRFNLSSKQMFWVEKFVNEGKEAVKAKAEYEARRAERIAEREAARKAGLLEQNISGWSLVTTMCDAANENLKTAKIRFPTESGNLVVHAKERSTVLEVRTGTSKHDTLVGEIHRGTGVGSFRNDFTALGGLNAFRTNPIDIVARLGKKTGNCCFCARDLTDHRSIHHGYGPICAKHFRLPWSTSTANELADGIEARVSETSLELTDAGTWEVRDADTNEVIATFNSRADARSFADEFSVVVGETSAVI